MGFCYPFSTEILLTALFRFEVIRLLSLVGVRIITDARRTIFLSSLPLSAGTQRATIYFF